MMDFLKKLVTLKNTSMKFTVDGAFILSSFLFPLILFFRFDPSNPVVPMSGTLRDDEIKSLLEWEGKADLCVAMGTTMCGMNSDRIFHSCAKSAFHTFRTGKVVLIPSIFFLSSIIDSSYFKGFGPCCCVRRCDHQSSANSI